jgi:hypothetical protein
MVAIDAPLCPPLSTLHRLLALRVVLGLLVAPIMTVAARTG